MQRQQCPLPARKLMKVRHTVFNQSYKVAGPDIVHEEFDGDLVVLNLGTGRYFGFNAAAAAIWGGLMAGARPARFCGLGLADAEIGRFVAELADLGLILADPEAADAALPEEIRQALAAAVSPPSVESYDDLSDLIVADPIHDVDQETGWPHGIRPE
jgi:hypothetical protein